MQRKTFKDQFDAGLHTYLSNKIDQLQSGLFCDDLSEIINFLKPYSAAGKRIRPYLVYIVYKISGGKNDDLVLQAGIVNELIHLFALIHDDITDQGITRHHLPTYHKHIEQLLHDKTQGVNLALMIGDILMSRAYEHLHQLGIDTTTKQYYFDMLNTTIYGQIQDIYLSHTDTLYAPDIVEEKDRLKSGNYSFMRPMLIGGHLAEDANIPAIQELGATLGLAYQMRDDLLDIIDGHGDKTAFSDHQEGNQTFLLSYAYTHATPEQQSYLKETRGAHCDEATQQKLLAIYQETNTIQRAKDQINNKLEACKNLLDAWTADQTHTYDLSYKPYLNEIIDFLFIPDTIPHGLS